MLVLPTPGGPTNSHADGIWLRGKSGENLALSLSKPGKVRNAPLAGTFQRAIAGTGK